MKRKTLLEQMKAVNKLTFNNAFDAVALLQDQSGKLTNALLDQFYWLPSESRTTADVWVDAFRNGRLKLKKQIDDGFKQLETIFPSTTGHNSSNS